LLGYDDYLVFFRDAKLNPLLLNSAMSLYPHYVIPRCTFYTYEAWRMIFIIFCFLYLRFRITFYVPSDDHNEFPRLLLGINAWYFHKVPFNLAVFPFCWVCNLFLRQNIVKDKKKNVGMFTIERPRYTYKLYLNAYILKKISMYIKIRNFS
jgi:hypothetical protein